VVAANEHRHLMTGTGAYFYIMWGIWLRHCLNGRQEEYSLYWPHVWSLPDVVKLSGKKHEMHANGDTKKVR
jgi:dihydroceramidase